jgi:hypothetical protein
MYCSTFLAKCPKLSSQKAPPGGPYIPRCGRQQQEDQKSLFLGVTVVRLHGACLNQIQTADYFIPDPVGLSGCSGFLLSSRSVQIPFLPPGCEFFFM